MLSEKSVDFLKKLGWTKKREIDLERTYPIFFREQAFLNKKKFAAIRPKLSNYCGISFDYYANMNYECSFYLYPYSILGLDGVRKIGDFLGFDVIFIGEADECVPILMSFDGRVFAYNDGIMDKFLYEFENVESLINAMTDNNWQAARTIDASEFKWK